MEETVDLFLKIAIVFSCIAIFVCFIRAVIGPSIADRLLGINMIGTQIIIIIAELTVLMGEAWLADVATVYALLSFLGVVVLTKIYIGIYRKEHLNDRSEEENGEKTSVSSDNAGKAKKIKRQERGKRQ